MWQDPEILGNSMHISMHADTCATLNYFFTFCHMSSQRQKLCWDTSELAIEWARLLFCIKERLFHWFSKKKKQSTFMYSRSWKFTALTHKQASSFPQRNAHMCVHAQTCTVLICGCAQWLSAAGDSPHKGIEKKVSSITLQDFYTYPFM